MGFVSALVVQPRCPSSMQLGAPAAHRHASFCVRMQNAPDLVTWFPPIDPSRSEMEPKEGATVMPLFPLGATSLPHTNPVLNIFEPRYRKV